MGDLHSLHEAFVRAKEEEREREFISEVEKLKPIVVNTVMPDLGEKRYEHEYL